MKTMIGKCFIELVRGDITIQSVDAIVNAANAGLLGGGGVDGAILRAGGPEIMKELKARYKGCPMGKAVISGAGKLKAKYVIHAVGPIYHGKEEEATLLASAYESTLEVGIQANCKSIAFPSISTGAHGYPIEEASEIALNQVIEFLKTNQQYELVRFILYTADDFEIYRDALRDSCRKYQLPITE